MCIACQQCSANIQQPNPSVQWLCQRLSLGAFNMNEISDLLLICRLPNFYPRLYFDKRILGAYWTISLFNRVSTPDLEREKSWKDNTIYLYKGLKKVNNRKIQQLQNFQPSSPMYLGCSIHPKSFKCPLAFQINSKGILTITLLSTDCKSRLSINQPIHKVPSSFDMRPYKIWAEEVQHLPAVLHQLRLSPN